MVWQCLFFVWIASEVLIATLTRTPRSGGEVRDRGTMALLWAVICLSITACEWLAYFVPRTFPSWIAAAALILIALGLVLRVFAVISLGKAFSANVAIQATQTLNQHGIYRQVRHPSYTGLLLIFLAIGLHERNTVSLACAIVPTSAILLYRIRVEEAALIEGFGPEYRAYMGRTRRLIPWIF